LSSFPDLGAELEFSFSFLKLAECCQGPKRNDYVLHIAGFGGTFAGIAGLVSDRRWKYTARQPNS
jgi:hypothetical protein